MIGISEKIKKKNKMSHSDKEKVVLYRTGKKMHRQDCLKRCLSL